MKVSIGVQLTLRYSAAVLVTVTVAGGVVYREIAHRINREARLLLEVQMAELSSEYLEQLQREPEVARDWMRERMERFVSHTDAALRPGVQLVSETGESQLVAGSLRGVSAPVSRSVLEGRRSELLRAINVGNERPLLAMEARVPGGALQVAIDTARYAENVSHVRDVFLLSLPLLLAATALIGWALARGSLRPIAAITRTARRISGANLDESVPQSGSGDELDELASTLNGMLARIDASMERIRRFNSNSAHELRTPLAAISNEIEVTLEKPRDSREYQEVLLDVLARARDLSGTIDAMLRLARAEAGIAPGERRPVMLREVIETVTEFFSPVAEEAGVLLEVRVEGESVVPGDPSWLKQLFSNLVSNALRHTPDGGSVTLRVRGRRTGETFVRVDVADTGSGISPEALDRVFERFERSDEAAPGSGIGLGLPIALEIARAHGGTIEVHSEPGAGTTFTVMLPVIEREARP